MQLRTGRPFFIIFAFTPKLLFNYSMKGFVQFIREQGVLGLAIGFLLGGSVQQLVRALVDDIINPVIGIFAGRVNNLQESAWVISGSEIRYGHFISVIIDFLIVAGVIYFVFKKLKLEQLVDKKKE